MVILELKHSVILVLSLLDYPYVLALAEVIVDNPRDVGIHSYEFLNSALRNVKVHSVAQSGI